MMDLFFYAAAAAVVCIMINWKPWARQIRAEFDRLEREHNHGK